MIQRIYIVTLFSLFDKQTILSEATPSIFTDLAEARKDMERKFDDFHKEFRESYYDFSSSNISKSKMSWNISNFDMRIHCQIHEQTISVNVKSNS